MLSLFSPSRRRPFIATDSEDSDNGLYDADTEEDVVSPEEPPPQEDNASSDEEQPSGSVELLGRLCALSSSPDIPAASVGHTTLALCTKEDHRGTLGYAVVSSATVQNECPGDDVEEGKLFITNAAVNTLSHPLDISPDCISKAILEVSTGDRDQLRQFELPRWYSAYMMAIWNTDPDESRIGMIADAIPPIQAGLCHIDFGVNQDQDQFQMLVEAVGTCTLTRMHVNHTQCDACRNMRHCTFKLGRLNIGSDCAKRIRAATPAVKLAYRLAKEIPLPLDFRFMCEGLVE